MPTFTEEAWRRNEALFQKTLAMPFNRELADGTLSAGRWPWRPPGPMIPTPWCSWPLLPRRPWWASASCTTAS